MRLGVSTMTQLANVNKCMASIPAEQARDETSERVELVLQVKQLACLQSESMLASANEMIGW